MVITEDAPEAHYAIKGERRARKNRRKNLGPTGSDKRKRAEKDREYQKQKRLDAEVGLTGYLERFQRLTQEQRLKQMGQYVEWVRGSLGSDPLIREGDILERTSLSSGPGGQNVQKNETKIRLTHKPTLISVSDQSTRDQVQNRKRAEDKLRVKLEEVLGYWQSLLQSRQGNFDIESKVVEILSGLRSTALKP